jgi:hypothetical protein
MADLALILEQFNVSQYICTIDHQPSMYPHSSHEG